MVLNYVRKMTSVGHWWSHLKQLWFANIANNILWWAYVKACFRVARAYYGRGLQFKSTAKGKGAIAAAAWNLFQDLGIPGACLILLIISLGECAGHHCVLQLECLHLHATNIGFTKTALEKVKDAYQSHAYLSFVTSASFRPCAGGVVCLPSCHVQLLKFMHGSPTATLLSS